MDFKYNKSNKICLVGPFPPPVGGMSIQADQLYRNLSKEGVSVIIINTNHNLKFISKIRFLRTIIQWIMLFAKLIVQLGSCETVFIFSCSYLSFFLNTCPAVVIGRLYRKKAIINYHGGMAPTFLQQWKSVVLPFLKIADLIVVPSDYLQSVFKTFNIDSQVIPNVIELENFRFKKRDSIKPKLIITRHHEKEYNVICAIEAFRIIKEKFVDAKLTLVGGGKESAYLKNFGKRLRIPDLDFIGVVQNEKLSKILDENDIFLNTSLVDNLPVSFFEAFASGLIVITTPAGGIPYLVKDGWNGFLSKSYNPQELAIKIEEVLHNQDKALCVIDNAKNFVEQFSWTNVKESYFNILKA